MRCSFIPPPTLQGADGWALVSSVRSSLAHRTGDELVLEDSSAIISKGRGCPAGEGQGDPAR